MDDISNCWTCFNKRIRNHRNILQKSQYSLKMIDHCVKLYLNCTVSCSKEKSCDNTRTNLASYISNYRLFGCILNKHKRKLTSYAKHYSTILRLNGLFTSKKLRVTFLSKDLFLSELISNVVYQFVFVSQTIWN